MAACHVAREDDLSKMMLSYPLRGPNSKTNSKTKLQRGPNSKTKLQRGTDKKNEIERKSIFLFCFSKLIN
jgi:hypothetical protein